MWFPDTFTRTNAQWVFHGFSLSTLIYTSELILCSSICVHSATTFICFIQCLFFYFLLLMCICTLMANWSLPIKTWGLHHPLYKNQLIDLQCSNSATSQKSGHLYQNYSVQLLIAAPGDLLLPLGDQEILVAPNLYAGRPGFHGFRDFGHPTTFGRAQPC